MRISVYVPLLVAVALSASSPLVATRLAPVAAVRILTAVTSIAAVASTWGLVLLALTFLDQQRDVAVRGHWSIPVLRAADPVPRLVAGAAALALLTVTTRTLRELVRHMRGRQAARALRCGATSELLIIDDPTPQAFAVPGREGHIAVSTGMLAVLNAQERRVLFAHERSHLLHRHDRYLLAGALAGALNPLLRQVQRDISFVCERWADEDASIAVASRSLVAQALTRAAVAALTPAAALGFERLAVPHRLAALKKPPTRTSRLLALGYALCAVVPAAAALDATVAMARLLDAAAR